MFQTEVCRSLPAADVHMGVFINGGTSKWFMMKNPTQMDDLGVPFGKHTKNYGKINHF
jgi:hypothetical protein